MFEIGLGCGVAEICGLVDFFISIPRAYHEHTFLNKEIFINWASFLLHNNNTRIAKTTRKKHSLNFKLGAKTSHCRVRFCGFTNQRRRFFLSRTRERASPNCRTI